jgi:hypothetical protein
VVQLFPLALVSLFVASYDSQGYGGGIITRLHTGLNITGLDNLGSATSDEASTAF